MLLCFLWFARIFVDFRNKRHEISWLLHFSSVSQARRNYWIDLHQGSYSRTTAKELRVDFDPDWNENPTRWEVGMNVERRNKRGNATLNVQLHCRESDPFLSISLFLSRSLYLSLFIFPSSCRIPPLCLVSGRQSGQLAKPASFTPPYPRPFEIAELFSRLNVSLRPPGIALR